MLVSPKWQMMWLESQYCSKSVTNWPLPFQQAQKVLEDLKTSCCSPNKAVQLEALKCWEIWISHQETDDWKSNTVCFTGVRPLITKKLQPLHKDVDICKMKLKLMWALLRKVQAIMHLEGPQYILEVFLQSCLTWLSSNGSDCCDNEISTLIFQLLIGIFEKNEILSGCDNETFPQLSTDLFNVKKVFYRFVDKFLNIFIHWRIIQDKNIFLKLWKHFLERCELSCEHIPTPIWHSIFKLAGQICSEKNETVKVRLALLHSCATSLNSALSSSSFIDGGNLLATPCEALLKKLVELCRVECDEFFDSEMFFHSKEICEVLLSKSVACSGLDFCISMLDVMEEFYLRSLFWGVWCGLVHCYKVLLLDLDKKHFTRTQWKFYRKLRGVAINFELDRSQLHKDCITEVEKLIHVLDIGCLCAFPSISKTESTKAIVQKEDEQEILDLVKANTENHFSQNLKSAVSFQTTGNCSSEEFENLSLANYPGKFSALNAYTKSHLLHRKTVIIKIDVVKETLKNIDINSAKFLFNCLLNCRFINLQTAKHNIFNSYFGSGDISLHLQISSDNKKRLKGSIPCLEAKAAVREPKRRLCKKNAVANFGKEKKTKIDDEVVSVRSTRSKKRAEEERKKEIEERKKKKRKSFEIVVQEIVKKNKERKTEKNQSHKKGIVKLKSKRNNKKTKELKKESRTERQKKEKNLPHPFNGKLKNSKKEETNSKKKKEEKPRKRDGKLENYFKVITKKSGTEVKKKDKKPQTGKATKRNRAEVKGSKSEAEGKGKKKNEIGWRQTSLKTMMNQKNKTKKVKQGLRTRHNAADLTDEKPKIKKDKKAVVGVVPTKLSPFKKVLHDHEYARFEPEKLNNLKRILLSEKKVVSVVPVKKAKKPVELKKPKFLNSKGKAERSVCKSENCEFQKLEEKSLQTEEDSGTPTGMSVLSASQSTDFVDLNESTEIKTEIEQLDTLDKFYFGEETQKTKAAETELNPFQDENKTEELKVELSQKEKELDCQILSFQESSDEPTDSELTPVRRDRKRVRMLDSLKPSKKIKLEDNFQEEKFPPEITEKENLEEKPDLISPIKTDKTEITTSKNEESPNAINGRISSRALRMIALVPESTKGGQMQWETPSRMEILKCKKAPNVDKNSRASKMLALLSENVVEVEESEDWKVEEVNSNKGLSVTPVSSMKLPTSARKRKFIRFDDAKNETVLYQTDTPPSQILEEKEKCRKTRSSDIIFNLS